MQTSGLKNRALIFWALIFFVSGGITLFVTADSTASMHRKLFGIWQSRYFILAVFLFLLSLGVACRIHSKETMVNFVLICSSFLFAVTVLEVAGHTSLITWSDIFAPKTKDIGQHPVPGIEVKGETYQDTATAWGLSSEPIAFEYRTDRYGYRNRIDRAEAEIYLVGDSILVGALVDAEEMLASRLEDITGKPVIQVALIGKSPQEMQARFFSLPLDLKNKLVLQFIFEGNDLGDSINYRAVSKNEDRKDFRERSFLNNILVFLQRLTQPIAGQAQLQSCKIDARTYSFHWLRKSFEGRMDEASVISASIEEFAGRVEDQGGRFAVVYVPSKFRVLSALCEFPTKSDISVPGKHMNPLHGYMSDWSQQAGIPLIDLTPALTAEAMKGNITWFWGDTHWNPEGHSVGAQTIADWVNSP